MTQSYSRDSVGQENVCELFSDAAAEFAETNPLSSSRQEKISVQEDLRKQVCKDLRLLQQYYLEMMESQNLPTNSDSTKALPLDADMMQHIEQRAIQFEYKLLVKAINKYE